MRVMGVDPGTHRTGVGILESDGRNHKIAYCGIIRANSGDPIARRLLHIFESLRQIIQSCQPDIMALESLFFAKDVRAVERIGEARACAMLAASKRNLEVIEYAPTAVKRSVTGNGRASKEQVQFMITRLLGLRTAPSVDASDALAVALCHIHSAPGVSHKDKSEKR
ncbi:MAG: Crossover junction endodeoxyribonuclease RuvC [Candidatus Omnitrophica bacterium ADurb.Bin277]|nr:MAG: Crossover junction endodeoxyribonuclease RuvC [Candidatus Omnitrophica bacterium ADurb.Bin277]